MAILTTDTTRISDRANALRRILKSYRSKISRYVESGSGFSLEKVMGCSSEELAVWIEQNLTEGMTWANYGDWWFANMESPQNYDMTNIEQFLGYFNFQSFKPMWRDDVKSPFQRSNTQGLPTLKKQAP